MKKIYMILGLAALIAAGCQKGVEGLDVQDNVIRFEAEYPATKAVGTGFENGDKIGLYAVEYDGDVAGPLQIGGNYLNNEALVYDGAAWNGERTLYWSEKACDFYAYYPYIETTLIDEHLFEVALDQSTPRTEDALGGYEASDLLWAKAVGAKRADGTVKLQFKHMMSKLIVKLVRGEKYEGDLPKDAVVHVYNTVTSAKVDFASGTLEKYLYGTKNTITAKKVSTDSFEAIVVPQNLERRTSLVEISMGGIAYMLDYSMSFRPGYQYTIEVTLNTSPEQEKIEISIDGSIDGWE